MQTFITEDDETKLHQVRGTLSLISELAGENKDTVLAANLGDAAWLLTDQLHSVLDGIKQRGDDLLKATNPTAYAIIQENRKAGKV